MTLRAIKFVGAALIPEGTVVTQLDRSELGVEFRCAFDRARVRTAADHPTWTLIAVEWEGKPRWVTSPIDVRMHLAPRTGVLRRRRVYRDPVSVDGGK